MNEQQRDESLQIILQFVFSHGGKVVLSMMPPAEGQMATINVTCGDGSNMIIFAGANPGEALDYWYWLTSELDKHVARVAEHVEEWLKGDQQRFDRLRQYLERQILKSDADPWRPWDWTKSREEVLEIWKEWQETGEQLKNASWEELNDEEDQAQRERELAQIRRMWDAGTNEEKHDA